MLNRRELFAASAAGVAILAFGKMFRPQPSIAAGKFAVTHSDADWKKLLTDDQFAVLRQAATETPFTSPLLNEHRAGRFNCAGCDLPLFSSTTKFDSGTGWPSFWQALDHALINSNDKSFGMDRTAISCSRCGGHIGHLFNDGPQPTGLRYCMNGVAMKFAAGAA
jgi:peptide-methionine (R)-S-oxide reductase